jgi:hypothetical protein
MIQLTRRFSQLGHTEPESLKHEVVRHSGADPFRQAYAIYETGEQDMKHRVLPSAALILCSWIPLVCNTLHAQEESEKINTNLGAALTLPVGPTGQVVKTRWGLTAGAGYNFNEHHSVIGEFMWNPLYPSDGGLRPIRVALQDNSISGHSNLFAVTGNYRFQLQGKKFGAYLIGGGGWYYRTAGLSKQVTSGTSISCTPSWLWWGFTCTSGTVTSNQTITSFNSSSLGGNAGVGFTIKVADPSYRVYIEPRYHYAPTKNLATQLIELTVGIRY